MNSSRNGRRHRKKTEEDPAFRQPFSKREELPVKKKIILEEAPVVVFPVPVPVSVKTAEAEENGKVENKKVEFPVIVINNPETTATESQVPKEQEKEDTTKEKDETANVSSNGNGTSVQDNGTLVEELETGPEAELEPLVVDSEDPELQFDDNSDADSHKSSPSLVLNRCLTRRSQTRNIPTPKTPRSVSALNGDEPAENQDKPVEPEKIEVEKSSTPVFDPSMETPPPTEENLSIPDSVTPPIENHEELDLNLSVESCQSAFSTQVNVGSDLTREIDLTLPDENSFLNTAKDLSVVETLRRMSSRRAIRSGTSDYRKTLLKSQAEKHEFVMQQQRASIEKVTGMKRKTRSKTPDNTKRFKTDAPPGFMSYISSPLTMLRNRFGGSGESVSASTPKLTGYREQEAMDPEISKIGEPKAPADKKRCIIM